MTNWIRICALTEAPGAGQVIEAAVEGVAVCLANVGGELSALDNWCPHRRGPLGQGWIEGTAVVCPWHSWSFDVRSGLADYPDNERVAVFPVKIEADAVLVNLPRSPSPVVVTSASAAPDPGAADSGSTFE